MLNIRSPAPKLSRGMATPWATLEQTAAGRPASHTRPELGLKGPAGEVKGLVGWVLPVESPIVLKEFCAALQELPTNLYKGVMPAWFSSSTPVVGFLRYCCSPE